MTQKDKEFLLIDLSARLPYGVICTGKYIEYDDNDNCIFKDTTGELTQVHFTKNCCYLNVGLMNECEIETVKPYLRPMSSMTEEERNEYNDIVKNTIDFYNCPKSKEICFFIIPIEWLNSHHFDYRGLIEKGLALEAPEDMYKTV